MKRIVIGKPLPSNEEQHQRLSKRVGLAVFASDAISSTAYATEEILFVLFPVAGFVSLQYLVPLAWIVVLLLAIVATSYRQTIRAYPSGGGSYVVARENLGVWPSLVAGSSLLVDYVLTVAVSVSAGVAAITSAVDGLADARVLLCIIAIAIIAIANLPRREGVGACIRSADVCVHHFFGRVARRRSDEVVLRRPRAHTCGSGASRGDQQEHRVCSGGVVVLADASVFVGRGRVDGCRSDLQRCQCVQEARVEERVDDPRVDGRNPGILVLRCFGSGAPLASDPLRARDRVVAGDAPGLRRLGCHVLDHAGNDVRDLDPRGQYRVRRLPEAVVDPRERPLPAPSIRQPR